MQLLLVLTIVSSVLAFVRSTVNRDDCIGSKLAYTIRVSQGGTDRFSRVQDAIDSIPSNNSRWIRVLVGPGTYIERVQIPYDKQCVILQGRSPFDTIISSDAHSTPMETTFSVNANNFMARDIGFKNTYGSPADGNWTVNTAVRVYGDKSAFYHCHFIGIQDTLWDVLGRHYFKSCHIVGAVDFIWGSGQSVYEDCSIAVLFGGYITAQGRLADNDRSGFVFLRGNVLGNGPTFLGRAYREYSRVVFLQTYLGHAVGRLGWDAWNYVHREQHITYIEANCSGPGARYKHRVPWMKKRVSEEELAQYTVSAFIDQDGWISKQPDVPSLSQSK